MSHNSKNHRRIVEAKARSQARLNGSPGPAKTTPKHGKRWTYRSNPEVQKRIAEALKARVEADVKRTVLEKMNAEKSKKALVKRMPKETLAA